MQLEKPMLLITGRNEVLAKVIFLHLSVIHSVHRGGGILLAWGGFSCHPTPPAWRTPGADTPPEQTPPGMENPPDQTPPGMENPPEQTPPPCPPDGEPPPTPDTPPGSRPRHTIYDRPVRILLECILVFFIR